MKGYVDLNDYVHNRLKADLRKVKKSFITSTILSNEEIALIISYTTDGYEWMNEKLRKDVHLSTIEACYFLNQVLAKLPDFQGVVYRGVDLSESQFDVYRRALQTHEPVQEVTFVSTSRLRTIGYEYSRSKFLFKIYSKHGKAVEEFSKFGIDSGQNEREVLFKPNTMFEVLDIVEENGLVELTLEEV